MLAQIVVDGLHIQLGTDHRDDLVAREPPHGNANCSRVGAQGCQRHRRRPVKRAVRQGEAKRGAPPLHARSQQLDRQLERGFVCPVNIF